MLEKLQADETQSMAGKLSLPLTALYPRSQLQLRYQYDYIKTGECGDIVRNETSQTGVASAIEGTAGLSGGMPEATARSPDLNFRCPRFSAMPF